ncbi:MAG: hypothetical protein ACLTTH_04845 [Holdemanella porci]
MSEFEKNEVNGKMYITFIKWYLCGYFKFKVSLFKIKSVNWLGISNPIYYKNQGMGISTFGMYKYIYLGEDQQ